MSADNKPHNISAAGSDQISEEMRNRYAQLKGMEVNGELSAEDREELNRLRPYFETND